MRSPAVLLKVSWPGFGFTTDLCWRIAYGANIRTSRMILLLGNITDNLFVQ